jgi:predicted nucleic acid-binding protein
VKVYFDTSVLIAAVVGSHPSHVQASAALKAVNEKQIQAFASTHGLAEMYAVLTRLPLKPAIYPAEAWQIVTRNVLPHFRVIDLNTDDYRSALQLSAESGWLGGRFYDVLHIVAAQKSECDSLYTYNLKHFQELAGRWGNRIRTP